METHEFWKDGSACRKKDRRDSRNASKVIHGEGSKVMQGEGGGFVVQRWRKAYGCYMSYELKLEGLHGRLDVGGMLRETLGKLLPQITIVCDLGQGGGEGDQRWSSVERKRSLLRKKRVKKNHQKHWEQRDGQDHRNRGKQCFRKKEMRT